MLFFMFNDIYLKHQYRINISNLSIIYLIKSPEQQWKI